MTERQNKTDGLKSDDIKMQSNNKNNTHICCIEWHMRSVLQDVGVISRNSHSAVYIRKGMFSNACTLVLNRDPYVMF